MNLDINWTFGFNKSSKNSVHSLSTSQRLALFYISSQYGIIYDYETRKQIVLQGHCNEISCCCVSKDKKWIVTGDSGKNSLLVIWDSVTGIPVKTISNPYEDGILSVDISSDSMYVSTIGKQRERLELSIWSWTQSTENSFQREWISDKYMEQNIQFEPNNNRSLISWGSQSISFWTWDNSSLSGYSIPIKKFEIGNNIGLISSATFLCNTKSAICCTTEGYVVLWDRTMMASGQISRMKVSKIFKLTDCGINVVTSINKYLVFGCVDGAIRFYDFSFRLEAWFEDLSAGSITSISFHESKLSKGFEEERNRDRDNINNGNNNNNNNDSNNSGNSSNNNNGRQKFYCEDFIVATSDAFIISLQSSMFDQVLVENRRGTLISQGFVSAVTSISCHYSKPLVSISTFNGTVQLWNYELRLLISLRDFTGIKGFDSVDGRKTLNDKKYGISCLRFQTNGDFIGIGFTNGSIKLVDSKNLTDVATYAPSSQEICEIVFSQNSDFMACYDKDCHVILFKRLTERTYEYVGRVRSHCQRITGLTFGWKEKKQVLISVGLDGNCVEYDLNLSSPENGVIFHDAEEPSTRLSVSANPTALSWCPNKEGDVEDRFLVTFDSFKIREFNADSKHCRKTTASPTLSGYMNRIQPVNYGGKLPYMAFSTSDKIVGIMKWPLTGNPNKWIGVAAHPNEVTDIAVSFDGKYLFSAGGHDLTVNMWKVVIDEETVMNETISDYIQLLDGGRSGKIYNDIVDYFYYCQIRAEGESIVDNRRIDGKIPLDQIANLMRAIGYFPSEDEIENMVNEIRFKHFLATGIFQEEVELEEIIKLYINHKPAIDFTGSDVVKAFDRIMELTEGDAMDWNKLTDLIASVGEVIPQSDLSVLLTSLSDKNGLNNSNNNLNANSFIEMII